MLKYSDEVGDCSPRWVWKPALLADCAQVRAIAAPFKGRGRAAPTRPLLGGFVTLGVGGRSWTGWRQEPGCGLGWNMAGSRRTWLQDQDCLRWVTEAVMSLLCLPLCSCWVWAVPWERQCLPRVFLGRGEMGGQRGSGDGRWFPEAAE